MIAFIILLAFEVVRNYTLIVWLKRYPNHNAGTVIRTVIVFFIFSTCLMFYSWMYGAQAVAVSKEFETFIESDFIADPISVGAELASSFSLLEKLETAVVDPSITSARYWP